MHWGHAISEDLIHWGDLPIVLTPTPGGPDERGCWSGCAVNNDGVPTIIYTGVRGERYEFQTQCIATGQHQLLTWEKYSGNPVLREIPAPLRQTHDFRDPFVWREGDMWYLILASRMNDVGGVVLLYQSPDLIHWEFLHPLLTGSIDKNGDVWECPNFSPLGEKSVLIVSGKGHNLPFTVFYFVGDFSNQQFGPEAEGMLDHAYLYAPLTMRDEQGRRLLWGWLREGLAPELTQVRTRLTDLHEMVQWNRYQRCPSVRLQLTALNCAPSRDGTSIRSFS
jgi:beta-fructofuranosidase